MIFSFSTGIVQVVICLGKHYRCFENQCDKLKDSLTRINDICEN